MTKTHKEHIITTDTELVRQICKWLNDRLPGNPKYKPEFRNDISELSSIVLPLVIANGGYLHVVNGRLNDDTVRMLNEFFDSRQPKEKQ